MLKHGVSGDIIGTTNAGEKVLVEVQQQGDDFFRDRVEYYISRVIENQVHTSEKYELPRIYFLGLLDFELFPEEPQKYIHHVDEMCNGRKFFPKIQKIFVEIDKFFELEKAGITASDNSEAAQWLRAIKVIVKEEPVPEKIMQNETFRHLLDSVKLINFVEELFNAEVKNMTDLKAEHEIGFSEGRAEGRAQGFSEGAAEERKKANEERLEMARAMLAEGDSIEKVTRIFKLSESEVLAVQAKPTAQGK